MNFSNFISIIFHDDVKTFGFYDSVYRDLQGYVEVWKTPEGRLVEVTSTMGCCCAGHLPEAIKEDFVGEVSEFVERIILDQVAMDLMISHIESLDVSEEMSVKRYGDRVETIKRLIDFKVRPGIAMRAAIGTRSDAN